MFQIQNITLGVKRLHPFDGWIPEYVTVKDFSAGRLFKFRHNDEEIDDTSVELSALG